MLYCFYIENVHLAVYMHYIKIGNFLYRKLEKGGIQLTLQQEGYNLKWNHLGFLIKMLFSALSLELKLENTCQPTEMADHTCSFM